MKPNKREKLFRLLKKYEPLFYGTLGTWENFKYDIVLKADTKPFHRQTYCIPKAYKNQVMYKVSNLEEI